MGCSGAPGGFPVCHPDGAPVIGRVLLGCRVSWTCLCACLVVGVPSRLDAAEAGGLNPALEVLQRLKGMDLEANPALKGAVIRVLETTRGTPAFVEIVRDFKVTGQGDGLLEVAAKHPEEEAGVSALRLLVETEGVERLRVAVSEADGSRREALVRAVARTADPRVEPLLAEAVADDRASGPSRAAAIRGLAQTESGARELLRLAGAGKLDETARNTAGLVLAQSRWPAVRDEALRVLPPPASGDGKPLPSVAELVEMRGNAARGAEVFRSERAGCIKCHRVGDEGVDFGPALGQIGTKLGRQALYDSILDPSAGIAFGYEGWTFELRSGDEVFGLVVSETAEAVTVRQQTGADVRIPRVEILRRESQRLSVMPSGLGQILGREELVDLVEYLTGLRAPVAR